MNPSRKTVRFICDSPGMGGSEINLLRVVSFLVNWDIDVEIVAEAENHSLLSRLDEIDQKYTKNRFPSPSKSALIQGMVNARRVCQTRPSDLTIVWAHHLDSSRWFQLYLALTRTRFLLVEQLVPPVTDDRISVLSKAIKYLSIRMSLATVVNAPSQIQNLGKISGASNSRSIKCIPNSRNVSRIAQGAKTALHNPATGSIRWLGDDKVYFLFLGRLHYQKRVFDAVQAINGNASLSANAALLIVGDGPDETDLKKYVEVNNIRNVRFFGSASNIVDYLGAADAFVLPSESEGMPGALIEAQAAGLASIVTNVPGNTDLVENWKNGVVVPVGDVAALGCAMEKLVEKPQLRAELSVAASINSLNFDQSIEADSWRKLIECSLFE